MSVGEKEVGTGQLSMTRMTGSISNADEQTIKLRGGRTGLWPQGHHLSLARRYGDGQQLVHPRAVSHHHLDTENTRPRPVSRSVLVRWSSSIPLVLVLKD